MTAVLAFAFGAGLVSPLNPCGFGLLPAFFGYQFGDEERGGPTTVPNRLWRGLVTGVAVSAGFAGVLMSAGLLVALGLRSLVRFVPAAALLVGLVLVGAGVAVLAGRRLSVGRLGNLQKLHPGASRDSSRLVAFGAGYAIASVACTIAILLAVVAQALAAGNLLGMLAVLAAYAAGAATLLTSLAVATAFAGSALSASLRRALPVMEPLSGVLLLLSGAYLVLTNLVGVRDTPAVQALSQRVTGVAAQTRALLEPILLWFVPVSVALVVVAVVLLFRRRRVRRVSGTGPAADPPTEAARDACCTTAQVGHLSRNAPLVRPDRRQPSDPEVLPATPGAHSHHDRGGNESDRGSSA